MIDRNEVLIVYTAVYIVFYTIQTYLMNGKLKITTRKGN